MLALTCSIRPVTFGHRVDFRKDNGAAIRAMCGQFIELCRRLKLFAGAVIAIDGSKFKAVNNRDQNCGARGVARHL
jgi:transposase